MGKSLINLSWSELEPFFTTEGFPASGVVDFELAKNVYAEHAQVYANWITQGKQGEMQYLARGLDRRLNPTLVFPELKSTIAVILPYSPHPVGDSSLRYARYLNGPDYHDVLKQKLDRVLDNLKSAGRLPPEFQSKVCVDTSAVLERTWAMLAGLGWIGKNTLLIHPTLGSYVFIGVIFTNASFNEGPKILKDYCGACTRCISACPTKALKSHDLNSNECISYLTLEKRGKWSKEINLEGFLAGCDLCQEVCPYNTKSVKYSEPKVPEEYLVTSKEVLLSETKEHYQSRVAGTALSRIKYEDFQRNLEQVLKQS